MKSIALESFAWAQELYPILKQWENEEGVSIYKVVAATSDIRNNNRRVYTKKQHEVAAASLSERPLNINHEKNRTLKFPENQVVAARYEDGHVECLIQVADPETNRMIESGEINHVSVEGVYLDESNNTGDTEYPTSLHYRALALLTRDDEPGDPETRIFKDHRGRSHFFTEKVQPFFEKVIFNSKVNTSALQKQTNEAQWTSSYVSDLPDSSFAAIQPGGKKDEEGKMTPRSLRHLPYKDASGKPDQAHVENALQRLSQTQISPALKAAARKKLVAAAKELGMQTSMDEAFKNFKIAKEILRATLEDDDNDSDADRDSVVQADLRGAEAPSQQADYASGGSMPETGASPTTVATGEPGSTPPSRNAPGGAAQPSNAPNVAAGNGGLQTDFTTDQAVKANTEQVPGAENSEQAAMSDGAKKETPNMDPDSMNPGLHLSPTAITNQPFYEQHRFKGRRVKLVVTK